MVQLHSDAVRTNSDISVGEDLFQNSTQQTPTSLVVVISTKQSAQVEFNCKVESEVLMRLEELERLTLWRGPARSSQQDDDPGCEDLHILLAMLC